MVITGTGKTTTAALVSASSRLPETVVTNAYGAKPASGVASALLAARPGTPAILEVDEAAFAKLAGPLQPTHVVVTNIYPDQLDRFPEPAAVRELLRQGIAATAPDTRLILCADDPELFPLAGLGGRPTLFFGAATGELAAADADMASACPVCGHKLTYEAVTIAQLGLFSCGSCDCRRPQPDLEIGHREAAGTDGTAELDILWDGKRGEARLALTGLYNAYNAAAALLAVASARPRLPREHLLRDLETARPAPGRQETLYYRGRRLRLILVKNTAGLEETLALVAAAPDAGALALLINNEPADGRDPAWVRAVRSERFPLPRVPIGIGGSQTTVLADWLRPQLGDSEPVEAENDLAMVDRLVELCPPERTIYLLPNYSALFALRRQLLENGAELHADTAAGAGR